MMNDYLHPSEIARLILGYLKEKKLKKTHDTLLRECSDLQEFWKLLYTGEVPSTSVMGFTLTDMLNGFCSMKLAAFHQALRQRDATYERAKFVHMVPESCIESPRPTTSESSELLKSSAVISKPLQSSTGGVTLSSQGSSNVGRSSADSDQSKVVSATSSASTMQESNIDPVTKTSNTSEAVVELEDPLERLLEETRLHEKLAESINRAMKDSSFLDELDEAIGGSDIVTERSAEGSYAPEKEIVRANINNVVALTTGDPKFEELLSLVEQDAPSILHPAGAKGDKTQDSESPPGTHSTINPSVRMLEMKQGRNQFQAPEHSQESSTRNSSDSSSLNPNDGVNLRGVMDTIQVNQKISRPSGAESPQLFNGSSANSLELASLSDLMPPPAIPVECSRRSRLKRVPKKSVHQPKDLFYKNPLGKDLGINKAEVSSCVPQTSQGDVVDSISKSQNHEKGIVVSIDHQNVNKNVDDHEDISSIHVSGQRKEQHNAAEAQLSHQEIMNQGESQTKNSDPNISRKGIMSSYVKVSCYNDEAKDGGNQKPSSCSEPDNSRLPSATDWTSSAVSAIASDNSKQASITEAVHVSSSSTICTMDENSLSVFSLIEKNIAEMHGETFIPRHLRNQQNVAESAVMTNPVSVTATSAVTSTSSSVPLSVNSFCEVSSAVTTVENTSIISQGPANKTSDVKGQVQPYETVETSITTFQKNHSPEGQGTSLHFSPSHFQEAKTHETDNASFHEDHSDSDFENRLSAPGAILVRPIGPYSSTLQKNLDIVDQCLQRCLGQLLNNPTSTVSVTSFVQQDNQRNATISASDSHDSAAVNRPAIAEITPESQNLINDLHSKEDDEVENLNNQNSFLHLKTSSNSQKEEKSQELKETNLELKVLNVSNNSDVNYNNTISAPFTCSKTSIGKKRNRKHQEPSGATECSSLPAVLPSMKQTSESPDSTYPSSVSKSAFNSLASSKFLQPTPFMSPTSSEFQSKRKVISVDCLHVPYIPDHCKKVPSRRITPVEVSSWTPSPLQVPSPSSPANLLIDIPSSPAVPASPMLVSTHAIPSPPVAQILHAGPLSPSVTTCHRKSLERTNASLSKDQRLSSLCSFKHDEERAKPEPSSSSFPDKETNESASESEMFAVDIRMPSSPSKRKPRRLVPKMLSHFTSKSRQDNSHTSPYTKNITFDDAKTVSSTSDLSHPSEAEAFRMLKSHLFTYTKPQPKQEITSSGQVLRNSPISKNSPLSKCACISRNTCKHRKGKWRSLSAGKTGMHSAKTSMKSNNEICENSTGTKIDLSRKSDTENNKEVAANCKEDSGNNFTRNISESCNHVVESVSPPLSDSIQKEKFSGCEFRVVGTMEFKSPERKSLAVSKDIHLRHKCKNEKENHVKGDLTLCSSGMVQDELVSISPAKGISPRCSLVDEVPCSSIPDGTVEVATESSASTHLTFEKQFPENSFTINSGSEHKHTSCKVLTKSCKEKLSQNKEYDQHKTKLNAAESLDCLNKCTDSDQSKISDNLTSHLTSGGDHLCLTQKTSSFVKQIKAKPSLYEQSLPSGDNAAEHFSPHSVTMLVGEAVDAIDKESTLIESEGDVSNRNYRVESIQEHDTKTVTEVSAPYFPELSNTHDFFKGKFLSTRDAASAPSHDTNINLSPPAEQSSNHICSEQRDSQKNINSACTDLDSVSESHVEVQNSANLTPSLKSGPLSPDLISGGVSLLRQAMNECDISNIIGESENSIVTHGINSITQEPNLTISVQSQTQIESGLGNEKDIGNESSVKMNVAAPKTPIIKPIQPIINHSSGCRLPVMASTSMQSNFRCGVTEPTCNSRYTPICPKTLPKGSVIVYAQHDGEMVPFLILTGGLPVMLPHHQIPPPPPIPQTPITQPFPAADVVSCTVGSDKVTEQQDLQAPPQSHLKKKDLSSKRSIKRKGLTVADSHKSQQSPKRAIKGNGSTVADRRKPQQSLKRATKGNGSSVGDSYKPQQSPKRATKGNGSTVEENYKPQQKIGVRRKGFCSTPENQTSSYFKRGLRTRKPSEEIHVPITKDSTELSGSTCESACSNRNIDGGKVITVAKISGHERVSQCEDEGRSKCSRLNSSSGDNKSKKSKPGKVSKQNLRHRRVASIEKEKEKKKNERKTVIDIGMKKQGDLFLESKGISGSEQLCFPNLSNEIPHITYRNKQVDETQDKLKGAFIGPQEKRDTDRKTKKKEVNSRSGKANTSSTGSSSVNAKVERVLSLSKDEENEQLQGQETERSDDSWKNQTSAGEKSGIDAKHNNDDEFQELPLERVSLKPVDAGNSSRKKAEKTDAIPDGESVSLNKASKNSNASLCLRKKGLKGIERNNLLGNEDEGNRECEYRQSLDIVKDEKELKKISDERKTLCTQEKRTSETGTKLKKLITPNPGEIRESCISPFSVQKDKSSAEGQVKTMTHIYDIVKVFTRLEKNKLKALSKSQGPENNKSTARRRSCRSSVLIGCKDYCENSDEEDEEKGDEVISDISFSAESHKSRSPQSEENGNCRSGIEKRMHGTTRGGERGEFVSQSQDKGEHNLRSQERKHPTPACQEGRTSAHESEDIKIHPPDCQKRKPITPEIQEKRKDIHRSQERKRGTPGRHDRKKRTPDTQEREKCATGIQEGEKNTPCSHERKKCSPTSQLKNEEETGPNLKITNDGRRKKIICGQKVAIQIFSLWDEIIKVVLLDHNPFPIYKPEVKSQPSSDTTPKSRSSKLRLKKAKTDAAKKTGIKVAKVVTSSTAEITNDKGKSSLSDHSGIDDIHSVDQDELNRAVLALEQADTSWCQLDWASRGFELDKSGSPIKYKNHEKSPIPALYSAEEQLAPLNTSNHYIPRTMCDSEKAFPSGSRAIEFQGNIKSVDSLTQSHQSEAPVNAVVKHSDDNIVMLSRNNFEESCLRKRKASPAFNKTEHSLKSCEKRIKQRRDNHQASEGVEDKKVGSVKFTKPSDKKKHKGSTIGSVSVSAVKTPQPIASTGASYLFSITEAELNDIRQKALERHSNDQLHESNTGEMLLGGLDLLSTVAVDAGSSLELSQSQHEDIISNLSHKLTKCPSDSMNKASNKCTAVLPSVKVDVNITKHEEGSKSILSSVSSSPSRYMSIIAEQSSQSLEQSSFSSLENISDSQSMMLSPSRERSISLSAKKRLLKKLYKAKKS